MTDAYEIARRIRSFASGAEAGAFYTSHGFETTDSYMANGQQVRVMSRDGAGVLITHADFLKWIAIPAQDAETAIDCRAYGFRLDGTARCTNAEPGTFNHECGKPAAWIGRKNADDDGACFCDDCKAHGSEARQHTSWERIA